MTDSRPDRPSAWVPGGHVLPAGRKRTKSARLAGSTCRRRRPRLAACSRTSRWRAHQRPSGSSMAEPAASRRARPVRARATVTGAPRTRARRAAARRPPARSTVTGPATSRWPPTHSASGVVARPSGRSASRSTPSAMARRSVAAQCPPTRPARPSARSSSNQGCHVGDRPAQDQREQEIVELVGVPGPGPHLVEHLGRRPPGRGGRAPRRPPAARAGGRRGPAGRVPGAPARPGSGAPRGARRRGR